MSQTPHAIIWWSGPSSQNLIHTLPKRYFEIGCNHIRSYRPVDCVVAYDRQIVNQLREQGLDQSVSYYTQPVWAGTDFNHFAFDKHYRQVHCSGTLAVEVALYLGHRYLHIIGADWHLTNDSIQQSHYEFRGHKPHKNADRKRQWLTHIQSRCEIQWIHPERAAWMVNYSSPKNFLACLNVA